MRFGKRKSPMRFGKRGQPMRFGKRDSEPMRFGKRDLEEADTLPDYAIIVKRIPMRFGKREDFDYRDQY